MTILHHHAYSRGFFSRRERGERRETSGRKSRHLFYLRDLGSAISRIHSFLTKPFHHEEHEGHEVLNMTNCMIFLRDLRGEDWVAARRVATVRAHVPSKK